MEIWIRSQDKAGLYKVNEIYSCDIYDKKQVKEKFVRPEKYGDYNTHLEDIIKETYLYTEIRTLNFIVGIYKTKERALEVLDEIQHKIETPNSHLENGCEYYMPNDGSMKVYEMPKD